MPVTIYHNPRCSKSRQTLELLESRDLPVQVIRYLDTPPDAATLRELARQLELPVRELLRANESVYGELGLDDPNLSDDELLAALEKHPVLLQRPIVVAGNRARIGRPPEAVLEILE